MRTSLGKKIVEIESGTLHLLRGYPWRGNIRELQNVIERAVIVADTETLSVDERWLKNGSPLTELRRRRLVMNC